MNWRKNKHFVALILIVLLFLFFLLLVFINPLAVYQLKLADTLYSNTSASDKIIIIDIDEKTIDQESGLGELSKWSRANYAKVINEINKHNPLIIGIDVAFISERDEEGDAELAKVLSKTNNPVIIYKAPNKNLNLIYDSSKKNKLLPIQQLADLANITISLSNAEYDLDDVTRRIIPGLFDSVFHVYRESFSFAIARLFFNSDPVTTPIIDGNDYVIQSKDGTEHEIPLQDGQMLINFSNEKFQRIPFWQIYYDYKNLDLDSLIKDKIVLIGVSAKSVNDLYFTPVNDKERLPGVDIHANAIQTIIEGNFIRNFTPIELALLIFFLLALSIFVFLYTHIRWSLVYLVAAPAVYTLAAKFAFSEGLIFDLVYPYLAIVAAFMTAYIYRYFTEYKEKNQLKSAFSKYVNPTIAQQISDHPESLTLGGEKREVTVLFTDIVNFTALSEKLEPKQVVTLLNEYFDAMTKIVMAEGGTVDKFIGDAIMAFWGAPLNQPNHALLAAKAALKMRIALNELMVKWNQVPAAISEYRPLIDFRCGISSGTAIIGNIGSAERFNYTAVGDIVNLGSRLEGVNKEYSTNTVCSDATYEQIKNEFACRELDSIRVVGKKQAVKIFEILGKKEDMQKFQFALVDIFEEGLDLYCKQRFSEAIEKFKKLALGSDDEPSKVYIRRCEAYLKNPPAKHWDGVFVMNSK